MEWGAPSKLFLIMVTLYCWVAFAAHGERISAFLKGNLSVECGPTVDRNRNGLNGTFRLKRLQAVYSELRSTTLTVQISHSTLSGLKWLLEFKLSYRKCKNQSRFTYGNLPAKNFIADFQFALPSAHSLINKTPWNESCSDNIIISIIIISHFYCNSYYCYLALKLALLRGHCKWWAAQEACGNGRNRKGAHGRHLLHKLGLAGGSFIIKIHRGTKKSEAKHTWPWACGGMRASPTQQ